METQCDKLFIQFRCDECIGDFWHEILNGGGFRCERCGNIIKSAPPINGKPQVACDNRSGGSEKRV